MDATLQQILNDLIAVTQERNQLAEEVARLRAAASKSPESQPPSTTPVPAEASG